jgi:hypothetical protein
MIRIAAILAASAPAAGASSSQLLKADPAGQYGVIKQLVIELKASPRVAMRTANYRLDDCTKNGIDLFDDGAVGQRLADLALQIVAWSSDLQTLGYPESLWKPMIESYEKQALDLMRTHDGSQASWDKIAGDLSDRDEAFRKDFASKLNAYRRAGHERLPLVDGRDRGDCAGSPGIQFKVSIDPPDAQAFTISNLRFHYCRKKNIDAYDRIACEGWEEAINGSTVFISGEKQYMAQWSDGFRVFGTIKDEGRKNGDPFIVRRPKQ